MQFPSAKTSGSSGGPGELDALVRQIGRLVRHPGYRRNRIVSALLLRHLPLEAGYAWQGETGLRERLTKAKLDRTTVDHLIGSVQAEQARLRGHGDT